MISVAVSLLSNSYFFYYSMEILIIILRRDFFGEARCSHGGIFFSYIHRCEIIFFCLLTGGMEPAVSAVAPRSRHQLAWVGEVRAHCWDAEIRHSGTGAYVATV